MTPESGGRRHDPRRLKLSSLATPSSCRRPASSPRARASDDEDEENYDEELDAWAAMTRNYDSILGVMSGHSYPPPVGTKRLLWHYRSKDERLIAFSNSQPEPLRLVTHHLPRLRSDEVITHELVPFVEGRVGQEDSVSDEVEAVVWL